MRGRAAQATLVGCDGNAPHPTPLRGATFSRKRDKEPARRDKAGGFTLVEVSLALLLIAVLAAIALPGLVRATGPSSLRIAAMQLAAMLREDRNTAQTTGRLVTSSVAAHAVRAGASSATLVLPPGASASVVGAGMPGIRFLPDGHSSGGAIVLASANSRILVAVDAETGAIHVTGP